ncbi:MAG TPA: YfhO family protein, partial [Chloroflexota bacterium]|nr:YfhO family protein [Chloroflexota bacterium]
AFKYRAAITWPASPTLALWGVTAVALGVILLGKPRRRPALAGLATIGILIGELAVGSIGLPAANAVPIGGVEVERHTDAFLASQNSSDRVMALGDNTYDPGDLTALRASVQGSLSPSAESAFVTAIKHAEGLTPNLFERFGLASIDGYDGGILPLARYDDFKKLFPVQGSDPSDGRLRLQLVGAPNSRLLGWLNVRYLLMDRLRDKWIDGVYYDLAVSAPVPPDSSVTLSTDPPFAFNRLGVMLSATPNGPPTGVLTVHAGRTDLKLNLEDPNVRRAGHLVQNDFDANGAWLWTLDAPAADTLSQVTIRWTGQQAVDLRSLSAIDTRLPADRTITTSGAYQIAFLEDMKVYVNHDVLPRAFLSRGVEVVPSVPAAIDAMRQPGWDPQATTLAVATDVPAGLAFRAAGDAGTTRMVEQTDQRTVVNTRASGQRLMVLTDSYYPGWQATIDGRPTPIYEVNLMFRGVVVPAGAHQVVFTYQPASWRVGLAGSALGIILLLSGLWLTRRRPPVADD